MREKGCLMSGAAARTGDFTKKRKKIYKKKKYIMVYKYYKKQCSVFDGVL